jgi:hypothetical protein
VGDYSKTTWVENVTQVGPTNLNKIEQGVADATKQASMDVGAAFDGSAVTTNDKKRVTWRRASDGSYMASVEGWESGSGATQRSVVQQRVGGAQSTQTIGALSQHIIEALTKGGAPIVTDVVRMIVEAKRGGGGAVRLETTPEGSADPARSVYLLDDVGYSDYVRVIHVLNIAARPAASAANQHQFCVTGTGQVFFNWDGATWIQLAGAQDPATVNQPSTGFGTHYINYTAAWAFQWWKDAFGYVHVVGEINDDGTALASLAANTLVWSGFPAGSRPARRMYFTVEGNSGTPNHFRFNTSGEIRVSDNAANNTRYSNFGHITFPTF